MFTLIGTTYGGDGQETFNLPDLQGRVPIHQGQGPGISQNYVIGEKAGVESVTLTAQQMPVHTHPMMASGDATGNSRSRPTGSWPRPIRAFRTSPSSQPFKQLNAGSVAVVGGSQPHDNMAPYLAISFIISLFGVFPSQG